MPSDPRHSVSRRDLLVGAVAVGAAAALPSFAKAEKPASEARAVDTRLVEQGLVPRYNHAVSQLDRGWALLSGGFLGRRATGSTLLIDTVGGEVRNAAPLLTARGRHTSITLADGRLLVMGGYNGRFLSSVEMYEPMTNRWLPMPAMTAPRADFVAVEAHGGVWLLGGVGPSGALTQSFYPI